MSERPEFEILCVTMNQQDFSKIKEMNIHSNVVFANQCNHTSYDEVSFDGEHTAKMISTETKGVGINRNLALTYGDADYCIFADDDLKYVDGMEELVLTEFRTHPDADVFIFHFDTDSQRKQKRYKKTRKVTPWEQMPWGGFRIAVKLDSIRKKNVWFSTLFGGGCIFPSGEDSLWLREAKKKGLVFYVSKETIGTISFDESTWFSGYNEKYYFGKGAYYHAAHSRTSILWFIYFSLRTRKLTKLKFHDRLKWLQKGYRGYSDFIPFDEFTKLYNSERE